MVSVCGQYKVQEQGETVPEFTSHRTGA